MLRLRDLLQADPNDINGAGIHTELFDRAMSYVVKDQIVPSIYSDLNDYKLEHLFSFNYTKKVVIIGKRFREER